MIAAPAIAAALGLIVIDGSRVIRPESPLFADPPARSLAEAITRGFAVEQAYAFIRAGQDPNEPIAVTDSDYTGGRTLKVSPLMLAVAARDTNVVQMLLNFGARVDLPQNRLAWCFARELGDEATANVIARDGHVDLRSVCPERGPDASASLSAWVAY